MCGVFLAGMVPDLVLSVGGVVDIFLGLGLAGVVAAVVVVVVVAVGACVGVVLVGIESSYWE